MGWTYTDHTGRTIIRDGEAVPTVAEIREMNAAEFDAYRQTVAAAERRTGLANVARCDVEGGVGDDAS